jgi:hypothetical protein
MNNVEKAFTLRLYCPRKQVVKRTIDDAFPALIVTQQEICVKIEPLRRKLSYYFGASPGSGG